MEQAYDSKSGWEWKQDRRTWDRLEALTLMCINANRSRSFMLTRYLKEFAMYFGCHPRTIRRALADGCYWREEVFGANVERIAFFSAERMEIKHKAAAEYINDYPRRKFGGRSSNEVHAAFLASA